MVDTALANAESSGRGGCFYDGCDNDLVFFFMLDGSGKRV